jgi:Sec7-like guanine-nucleotide exchange factor
MSKQDWFKMNKGCNGQGDFEYKMLYDIYDNCAHEPLRLRGEKDGYGTPLASSAPLSVATTEVTIPIHTPPHEDTSLRSLASHFTNILLFWSTYSSLNFTPH